MPTTSDQRDARCTDPAAPLPPSLFVRHFNLGSISLFLPRPSCVIQLSRTRVLPSTEAQSPHALGYHRMRS